LVGCIALLHLLLQQIVEVLGKFLRGGEVLLQFDDLLPGRLGEGPLVLHLGPKR
jgi:hypothetical protein